MSGDIKAAASAVAEAAAPPTPEILTAHLDALLPLIAAARRGEAA